jgi:hypothetical protein
MLSWWECKLAQSLGTYFGIIRKKYNIPLSYDSEIPFLGRYLTEIHVCSIESYTVHGSIVQLFILYQTKSIVNVYQQ